MSSGSGNLDGYSVEARSVYTRPDTINGQIFDERWATVIFNDNSPIGVPRGSPWHNPWLTVCQLYSYPAAQALRWWFHACSEHSYCLETRLVKHKIKYSYEATRDSEHCLIAGENHEAIMPDYGQSKNLTTAK